MRHAIDSKRLRPIWNSALSAKHRDKVELQFSETGTHGGIFGVTSKTLVGMPSDNTALGRTVRLHEALHTHQSDMSKKHKEKLTDIFGEQAATVYNAIGDTHLHMMLWPKDRYTKRKISRDALSTAFRDLRQIATHQGLDTTPPVNVERFNLCCLMASRALAIVQCCAYFNEHAVRHARNLIEQSLPSSETHNALSRFVNACTSTRRGKPDWSGMIDAAKALFLIDPEPQPGNPGKEFGEGDAQRGNAVRMRIEELPHTHKCESDGHTRIYTRGAGELDIERVIHGITHGGHYPSTHYYEPRQEPQGTVLIDASGSMDHTLNHLHQLCRMLPAAQIALYSGNDVKDAKLVIYAKDGQRNDEDPIRHSMGGNVADLPALQWLLRQPGPHVMVTDLGFCGGALGDSKKAKDILASACRSGNCSLWNPQEPESIPEAYRHLITPCNS
jgi:hypothetical protein